jgi:hypothetical protein
MQAIQHELAQLDALGRKVQSILRGEGNAPLPAELNGLAVVIDPESNFIIRVVDRCPSTTAGRRTAKADFCDVTLQAEQWPWT